MTKHETDDKDAGGAIDFVLSVFAVAVGFVVIVTIGETWLGWLP